MAMNEADEPKGAFQPLIIENQKHPMPRNAYADTNKSWSRKRTRWKITEMVVPRCVRWDAGDKVV